MNSQSEPMFNVPRIVTATLAVMVVIHAVRELALSQDADNLFLLLFAFVPARYDAAIVNYPGGLAADVWTFVTYALIHGNLMHIGFNAVWFLAFGSPVARRFGTGRFLGFFAVTAAAGAATHLATHVGDPTVMIGASAAISGLMGASIRFVFQSGGPLGLLGSTDDLAYRVPAPPLLTALRDPRIIVFLVTWFGLNVLFGADLLLGPGEAQAVATDAHVGGFLAGLLGFAAFDPVGRAGAIVTSDPDAPAEPD